ncbi:pseudaminic acid synthase [Verrucomicrobiaceae bacterium 227]
MPTQPSISIDGRTIGPGHPTYIIAEVSANHHHQIDEAIDLIRIAADCGADAVKIQTYTPDTMTIDCDNEHFLLGKGTIWEGQKLYDLYGQACTPWDWTAQLQAAAKDADITLFSTPFDASSVAFLEKQDMPAYKIASFELTDHPLLRHVAATGKPVILSTGMGTLREISEAVEVLRESGCRELALLKCTSAYPATPDEANLARIPHMRDAYQLPVGLSDHTMGATVPALAVGLGACIIEKHFTKSRETPGPDSAFSMEPSELREMISAVRIAEQAIGKITYDLTEKENNSRVFRRSVFVVQDIKAGEILTTENTRIIRPGFGLPPKELPTVLGRTAKSDIPRGTPVGWDLLL